MGSDSSGDPLSTVNLSPGGIYESMIPTQTLCQSVSSICFAASAGLYNAGDSTTAISDNSRGLVWQWGSSAAINTTGQAVEMTDVMYMNTSEGLVKVPNSTISAINQQNIFLPDGGHLQVQLGSLSLGAPGDGTQPLKTVIGQNFPSYLAMQNVTPSNSFSLHYGSASLGLAGTLVWGGYDQSRVVGDVGSFQLGPNDMMVPTMLDVQIGVENGQTPFIDNGSSFPGLLELNSSLNNVQPTIINPIVPYLFMSPKTCAAIAQHLPVSLDSDIGLYIWNTTDLQFQRVMSSSAYLAFIFRSSPDANITIKVPFQLLNLTLESPIVQYPQQYFPCRPFYSMDGTGNYFLGKAFLQAAMIGINWQIKAFFLAQAPGPEVPSPNIQSIGPSDTSIRSLPEANFASSWSKSWTLLAEQSNGTAIDNTTNATKPATTGNSTNPRLLSTRAKIGVGFGAAIGFLTLLAAGIITLVYRHRKLQRLKAQKQERVTYVTRLHELQGRDTAGLHELSLGDPPHEKDASKEYHEKHSRNLYEMGAGSR